MELIKKKRGNPNWSKGMKSPNPHGSSLYRNSERILMEALTQAATEHGKHLIEHFVDRAYKSDTVLIAIMKKIISDKIQGEGFDSKHITQVYQGITIGELRNFIEGLRERVGHERAVLTN